MTSSLVPWRIRSGALTLRIRDIEGQKTLSRRPFLTFGNTTRAPLAKGDTRMTPMHFTSVARLTDGAVPSDLPYTATRTNTRVSSFFPCGWRLGCVQVCECMFMCMYVCTYVSFLVYSCVCFIAGRIQLEGRGRTYNLIRP